MAVTFSYGGWTDMTNVRIDRLSSTQEPGGDVAQRASTLWIIEGTGIVAMTADANATTGVRRRLADIQRILTTPGQRLTIAMDGVTIIDHSSADYSPGGSTTKDFLYGPFMSAEVQELSGARCALVHWKAECRMWSDVSLNPITGFEMQLRYEVDRTGFTTVTRSGVLTVRRSADFPTKDGSGLTGVAPTVIAFIPGQTQPFGGGQSPTASGVPTTLGNNPDLYRRFVSGPLFVGFIRETQNYYIDETFQKLFFSVTDRQVASPYPSIVTEASVRFSYQQSIEGGQSPITKVFSAELYGPPNVSKSALLAVAVQMSQNRIVWTAPANPDEPRDMIVRMGVDEPDMLNKNGIVFTVTAISANLLYSFSAGPSATNIFSSILTGVATIGGEGGASSSPDAYGVLGLCTIQDFVYEPAPLNTHVSPNTTGNSLMGRVPVQPVVAQIVPGSVAGQMEGIIGPISSVTVPAGSASGQISEAPRGYYRVDASMDLAIENRIVVANPSPVDAGDRVYQFGNPRVIITERVVAMRSNAKPDQNVLFASIPWMYVELEKNCVVSPPKSDANGNIWYTGIFTRTLRVLSGSMTVSQQPTIGSVVMFDPASMPTPNNPQIQLPNGAGSSPIPASPFIVATPPPPADS